MYKRSPLTLCAPLVFLTLALSLTAASAHAQCDNPKTDAQRAQCIGDELRGSDRTINRVYGELMKSLSPDDRSKLREDQRSWIKRRDHTCNITWSKGDREAWMADLLRDYQKTVCVVRFTNERVESLAHYQTSNAVVPATPPSAEESAALYDLSTAQSPATGKWYFEIKLDHDAIRNISDCAIFAGIIQAAPDVAATNQNGNSYGSLFTIRHTKAEYDTLTVGYAVDLDNGKLYASFNGDWPSGAPGSSGGIDVVRGRAYKGWVSSSTVLNPMFKAHAFEINFGDRAFVYHTPDGYSPLQSTSSAASNN